MADAGFFKGTSADQDRRFSDKELKLLKSMKFPPEFDKKVDMRKVNVMVIRPWIAKKVVELVGIDDEVVIEYAMGFLEDKDQPTPDPKKMQINLTGFLTNSTPAFMSALWSLLLEAQNSQAGIPQALIDEKKEEMRRARAGDTRALDERDRRARLDDFQSNDRGGFRGGRGRGRGRGRGGYEDDRGGRARDNGWGGRGGGTGRSNRRFSRSPPPRRRSPSVGSRSPPRRYRSPGYSRSSRSPPPIRRRLRSPSRSISRSRSPPPSRRRRRSASYSPRNRLYRAGGGNRDSRSPPPRRRRISPAPGSAPSRSPSRSRSPPPRIVRRRRSASPPRKRASRRSPSRSRSRSMPRSGSPPPRRGSLSRDRGGKSRRRSPTRSRDSSRSRQGGDDTMEVDGDAKGGFKIKGQAEVERRRSKWEDKDGPESSDLDKRENELKEKALRNKVVRTRKGSSGA